MAKKASAKYSIIVIIVVFLAVSTLTGCRQSSKNALSSSAIRAEKQSKACYPKTIHKTHRQLMGEALQMSHVAMNSTCSTEDERVRITKTTVIPAIRHKRPHVELCGIVENKLNRPLRACLVQANVYWALRAPEVDQTLGYYNPSEHEDKVEWEAHQIYLVGEGHPRLGPNQKRRFRIVLDKPSREGYLLHNVDLVETEG